MPLISGPFAVAATLLVVSGMAKTLQPSSTVDAIRAVGLPASRLLVLTLAAIEVGVGTTALLAGGPAPAVAIAGTYALFAGFVVLSRVRGVEARGCGCLGAKSDAPPGMLHLGLDIVAAGVAVVAVFRPVPGLLHVVQAQPWGGAPFVAFVGLGTWLATVLLTDLPRLNQVARGGSR